MDSPLSPIIANFFMERLEQLMLESARLKPKIGLDTSMTLLSYGITAKKNYNFFFNTARIKTSNSPWKRKKMVYFLFSTYWYQETGTDLGTKSTENRHILTDICTRNPIIVPAKKEEL